MLAVALPARKAPAQTSASLHDGVPSPHVWGGSSTEVSKCKGSWAQGQMNPEMAYQVLSVGQEDLSSLLTAIIRLPEELNNPLKSLLCI